MWQIWNLSQATGRAPSKILQINSFARRLTKMPDMWTAFMFDSAVLAFGNHVENQLRVLDGSGRPKYTLRELLDAPYTKQELRALNAESLRRLDLLASRTHGQILVN